MINWKDCIVSEYTPSTLCEICENACGGCSWSKKNVQNPVEGWTALRNDLPCHGDYASNKMVESYVVIRCPEYIPDKFAEKYPLNEEYAKKRAMIRISIKSGMRGMQ